MFWVILVPADKETDFTKSPPPTEWDFTNGHLTEITGIMTNPNFHKFKVRGTFHNDIDFKKYPFEIINLEIHMEPYHPNTTDKVLFQLDDTYSGIINVNDVSIPGWNMGQPKFDVTTFQYAWGNFSHFTATFPVETTPFGPFLKKILPVLILIVFGFATFGLSARNISDRIAIISAVLLSAIMFHATFLLSEVPPIGYLTLADKIMMTAYALFLFNLFVVLLHRYLYSDGKNTYTIKDAELLDKKMAVLAVAILGLVFAVLYYLY